MLISHISHINNTLAVVAGMKSSVCLSGSVKERCLAQQKKRRQRATKKICVFIGSFILCFSPYVITR